MYNVNEWCLFFFILNISNINCLESFLCVVNTKFIPLIQNYQAKYFQQIKKQTPRYPLFVEANVELQIARSKNCSDFCHIAPLADQGGARDAPLGAKILSISWSFRENLAKSYVGTPLGSWRPLPGEILDPPLSTAKVVSLKQRRIQDFPRGVPTLRGAPTYDFAKFS